MRRDWVSPSAGTLVIGAIALMLGTLLSPGIAGKSNAAVLASVVENDGRLLGMAVFYFVASVCLLLGLPALLSLFQRRPRLALASVAVFTVGVLGTAGFAVLLVLFRAMVVSGALTEAGLEAVAQDPALVLFVYTWIVGFYAGLVLIAAALFATGSTRIWIPLLLLGVVAVAPFVNDLGTVGPLLQALSLAVAFTGAALSAVASDQVRSRGRIVAY
jgi:MFS family permease